MMTYDKLRYMSGDLTATAVVTPEQEALLEYVRRMLAFYAIWFGRESELEGAVWKDWKESYGRREGRQAV